MFKRHLNLLKHKYRRTNDIPGVTAIQKIFVNYQERVHPRVDDKDINPPGIG